MGTINFGYNEIVQIDNESEFDEIYHLLRSANTIRLEDWKKEFGIILKYPLYLEYMRSAFRGDSIGFTHEIEGKKIISLDDAKRL